MKSWIPPPLLAAAVAVALGLFGVATLSSILRRRANVISTAQPAPAHALVSPDSVTPVLLSRGEHLYLNSCAHCHGNDARGDEGPDLHDLQLSDRRIATVIQRGIKGEMPSFAKKHNAADVMALIAYLRTLTEVMPLARGGS